MVIDENAIQSYLAKLGLSGQVIDLYLSLYVESPQTMSQLSRNTHIERTKLYRLLDSMQASQLFIIEGEARHKVLRAAPADSILSLIHEKQGELKTLRKSFGRVEEYLGVEPTPVVPPRAVKRIRGIAVSAVVLLVLFLGAGGTYVLFADKGAQTPLAETPAAPAESSNAPIAPTKPQPRSAEGAAVEVLSSPVARGSIASISVQTDPASACTIAVVYNNIPSNAAGLGSAVADAYGTVSWNWVVPTTAPIGTWPVTVTCAYNGQTGVVQGDLQVTT